MSGEFGEKAKELDEALHGIHMAQYSNFMISVWPEILDLYKVAQPEDKELVGDFLLRLKLVIQTLDDKTKSFKTWSLEEK